MLYRAYDKSCAASPVCVVVYGASFSPSETYHYLLAHLQHLGVLPWPCYWCITNNLCIHFNSKSLFAILHEYTHNTERANNADVYDASFTSNKVQRNHQIKWQKGARNLRRFMGPLTVEKVYFEKRNKTSAGGASAASSRYRAVLKLWMKIHNFMMDFNL